MNMSQISKYDTKHKTHMHFLKYILPKGSIIVFGIFLLLFINNYLSIIIIFIFLGWFKQFKTVFPEILIFLVYFGLRLNNHILH